VFIIDMANKILSSSLSLWLSPMLEHDRNVTGFTSHTASSRRRLTTSDYWLSVGAEPYHQWP